MYLVHSHGKTAKCAKSKLTIPNISAFLVWCFKEQSDHKLWKGIEKWNKAKKKKEGYIWHLATHINMMYKIRMTHSEVAAFKPLSWINIHQTCKKKTIIGYLNKKCGMIANETSLNQRTNSVEESNYESTRTALNNKQNPYYIRLYIHVSFVFLPSLYL